MDNDFEQQKAQNDLVYDLLIDRKIVKPPKTLTKSKFLHGLQCPKLLWTACNAPDTIPPPSEKTQRVFDVGRRVGEFAIQRFPGGKLVQEVDFIKNIEETQALLSSKDPRPIYEAGVKAGRLYSRADILVPSKTTAGAWDVVEVKCGTDVKDIYLQDISFQRYCYEQARVKIGRCFLMHINNEYVRSGDIDVERFFNLVDVTEELAPFTVVLPERIDGFLKIIDLPKCPAISIGEYCSFKKGTQYECAMKPLCWAFLPKEHVLELTRGKDKGFDLIDKGILRIADIPDNYKLSDKQMVQRQCAIARQPFVDEDAIRAFVKTLRYPLWHMDFETVSEAIPRFNGTWPYQQVPFQFSVHLQRSPGADPEHFEFLHKESTDPRSAFIKALHACLGAEGTILAWNMGFEKGRIKELGEAFSEYTDWCNDVNARTEDLIIPFRSFSYYHPDQHGAASLKKVLPALMGKGYEGMAIADGGQAPAEYSRVIYGKGIDREDREKVFADLIAYCGLDTKAMVDLLEVLRAV
jgi:hypothetical protein